MNVLKTPADISFSKNPMPFIIEMNSMDDYFTYELNISITVDNVQRQLYSDTYKCFPCKKTTWNSENHTYDTTYPVKFDISDIVNAFVENLHKYDSSRNGELNYYVNRLNVNGDESFEAFVFGDKKAIPGGISKDLFIELYNTNTDIFERRFKNVLSAFFLTTRKVVGDTIFIHKEELSEVSFFMNTNYTYELRSGANIYPLSDASQQLGMCLFFFSLADVYNQLQPSDGIMAVCIDGGTVFNIQVVEDSETEEKYLFEFRNSLGFLEKILITGEASENPQVTSSESYNTNNGLFFEKKFPKNTITDQYNISSGPKITADMDFIKDLLISDEVYFIDDGLKRKCRVTGDLGFSKVQSIPESISFVVNFITDNENSMLFFLMPDADIFLEDGDGELILTSDEFRITL